MAVSEGKTEVVSRPNIASRSYSFSCLSIRDQLLTDSSSESPPAARRTVLVEVFSAIVCLCLKGPRIARRALPMAQLNHRHVSSALRVLLLYLRVEPAIFLNVLDRSLFNLRHSHRVLLLSSQPQWFLSQAISPHRLL